MCLAEMHNSVEYSEEFDAKIDFLFDENNKIKTTLIKIVEKDESLTNE